MKRAKFLKLSAGSLSVLWLSGCGWRLGGVNQQSGADQGATNKLYIYTWASYTDQEFIDKFTLETGFEVRSDVFGSNEEMLAKFSAGGARDFSIIYPSDYAVRKMIKDGLLSVLDRSRLRFIDTLKPQFQDPPYDPNNAHSVPISWGTTGLIYNPQKLRAEPYDWSFLWSQQDFLSKRMTLLDDPREVFGATLKSNGHSYNSVNPKEIEAAYQKLKALRPSLAGFRTDGWQDQIIAGDLFLAMVYSSDAFKLIKEKPYLKYIVPESGSSLWTDTLIIPKIAPNVDGAYDWINFVLEPKNAAQQVEKLGFAIPSMEAFKLLPDEFRNNPTLFPPDSIIDKCERILPLEPSIEEIYNRYWTLLTS